jgi:hypothetical protein
MDMNQNMILMLVKLLRIDYINKHYSKHSAEANEAWLFYDAPVSES